MQDRDIHSLEELLRHLKITFTETQNLSQLNCLLIELVEETNSEDYARALIKSARDTALDNFIMGLKR